MARALAVVRLSAVARPNAGGCRSAGDCQSAGGLRNVSCPQRVPPTVSQPSAAARLSAVRFRGPVPRGGTVRPCGGRSREPACPSVTAHPNGRYRASGPFGRHPRAVVRPSAAVPWTRRVTALPSAAVRPSGGCRRAIALRRAAAGQNGRWPRATVRPSAAVLSASARGSKVASQNDRCPRAAVLSASARGSKVASQNDRCPRTAVLSASARGSKVASQNDRCPRATVLLASVRRSKAASQNGGWPRATVRARAPVLSPGARRSKAAGQNGVGRRSRPNRQFAVGWRSAAVSRVSACLSAAAGPGRSGLACRVAVSLSRSDLVLSR